MFTPPMETRRSRPAPKSNGRWILAGAALGLCLLAPWQSARAVPSYARQTGLTCASCHTIFPELTVFGRTFKLNAYTMSGTTQGQTQRLEEEYLPGISAMIQASYTVLREAIPGTQNGNALLPDQLSLFYAGRVSGHLGTFVQLTYEGQEDHFSMDNTDIRVAGQSSLGGSLIYGLDLNNNPTVQDVWNSTPAWGFPYESSPIMPVPIAATLIDGTLGQEVVGLGAYGYWRNRLYTGLSAYRSSPIGEEEPLSPSIEEGLIKGVMPCWRGAWSFQWDSQSLEIGTYGLWGEMYAGQDTLVTDGGTNTFTDLAVDAQYQFVTERHQLGIHSTWIHERQRWDAGLAAGTAANAKDVLRTFKADAVYYYQRTYGVSAGFFSTTGDRDALLYAPEPIYGSRTGSPDTRGFILELSYVPWYNTKFSAQYAIYDKFNGSGSDYDGFGRNASDNNTLYFNVWLMY